MFSADLRLKAQTFIKQILDIWKDDVKIVDIDYPNVPFDEFEIKALFFRKIYVGFAYDRSTLDIGVMVDEQYTLLNKLTDEVVYRGFKSCLTENLLHNFSVLDKVLRSMV